jgi:hypothetical protein
MQCLLDSGKEVREVRAHKTVETQIPLELRVEIHGIGMARVRVSFSEYAAITLRTVAASCALLN